MYKSNLLSYKSLHVLIPKLFKINSVILPIPGIFLTSKLYMNYNILSLSYSSKVCPSGLFISVHILANILLHEIPALHVNCVASLTFYLISQARSCFY